MSFHGGEPPLPIRPSEGSCTDYRWGEATVEMGRSPTTDVRQGLLPTCIIDTVSDIALVPSWPGRDHTVLDIIMDLGTNVNQTGKLRESLYYCDPRRENVFWSI